MWKNLLIGFLFTAMLAITGFNVYTFYKGVEKQKEIEPVFEQANKTPTEFLNEFKTEKQTVITDSLYYSIPDFIMYDILQNIGTMKSKDEIVQFYMSNKQKYDTMLTGISLQKRISTELNIPPDTLKNK